MESFSREIPCKFSSGDACSITFWVYQADTICREIFTVQWVEATDESGGHRVITNAQAAIGEVIPVSKEEPQFVWKEI